MSARTAASLEAPPSGKSPFIVDAPSPMLKRHFQLSKNARRLYMTMRALADGRTGELKINGRWLTAKKIESEAEMCRGVRLPAMRELIAAGLVAYDFERVVRLIGGRRRAVRSRTRYTVHRTAQKPNVLRGSDPQIVEKPRILLKSISCSVEKIDSQVVSRLPSAAPIPTAGFEFVGETVGKGSKSSLPRAQKTRDVQRTNPPPLPCYEDFKDQFPGVTSRQFAFAVERISSRAKTPPRTLQFWLTSLRNFFEDIEAETDLFLTDRAVALFQSGATIEDVAESLKGEAASRDLAYGADLIDRIMCQAVGRLERDRVLRSELLGVGARQ